MTLGAATLALMTVFGCEGTRSPAGGSDGSGGAGATDGGDAAPTSDGITAGDAMDAASDPLTRPDSLDFDGNITSNDMTCHALTNTAPWILATTLPDGTPIPELHGGTIANGRYELVAAEHYPPAPGTGFTQNMYRRTAEFASSGASSIAWTVVDVALNSNTPADPSDWLQQRVAFTFVPTGATLVGESVCPAFGMSTYGFEATADTVTMWFETGRTLLHYLRVP